MNSLLSAKWTREKEKMKMRAGISRSSSHVVIIMFSLVVISSCCLIAVEGGACRAGGSVRGKKPPPAKCNKENNSDCCKQGQLYSIFQCSLPVTKRTMATLTLNSFVRGREGRGASECDGKFHLEDTSVLALSTGWFNQRKRRHKSIIIFGNGRRVKARVVDECDCTKGCDAEHDFQPPCPNNVVDASKAVWEALGVPNKYWAQLQVEWSNAPTSARARTCLICRCQIKEGGCILKFSSRKVMSMYVYNNLYPSISALGIIGFQRGCDSVFKLATCQECI